MQNEWHRPEVNRQNVWQGYVDSYNNHAFGILQENCQNSFDAFPSDTQHKDMKIIIKYDADKRILTHQDFNTSGMTHCNECNWGIKSDESVCLNPKCSWGTFHNMGFSGKGNLELGSRGMGKSLQLLAGSKTIVITTLSDGESQASIWDKESGDWRWRLAPEEVKELSSPGTEIITTEIIQPVHEQLIDSNSVVKQIQQQWFRLLSQGVTIEYILTKGGEKQRHIVPKLHFPEIDSSQEDEKAKRFDPKVIITYKGEKVGELHNLTLYLTKKEFSEEDPLQGIAIIKNGKQTITWYNDFPSEIPESIRRRIFGFCDAFCSNEEPFLKVAETSQHTGYQWSHPIWKATRTQLREIVKQFVQPFLRTGGERVTEAEQEEGKEILTVFNQALKFVPEFSLFGKELTTTSKSIETTTRDYIYLSRIDFDNRTYKRGEKVQIDAVIKNPTNHESIVITNFQHFDPTPVVVEFSEESAVVPPGTPDEPGTKNVEWELLLDPSQAPGLHWIQVYLKNYESAPLVDKEGNPIKGRRHIYCELEPKKIERHRSGTGEPREGTGKGGGDGEYGLADILIIKRKELSDSLEAYIDPAQGIAFFNLYGRRVDFARRNLKSKRSSWPIIGEVIAEKLLELKASSDAGEKEQWNSEELKNKVLELEQNKAKLVRKMAEILG